MFWEFIKILLIFFISLIYIRNKDIMFNLYNLLLDIWNKPCSLQRSYNIKYLVICFIVLEGIKTLLDTGIVLKIAMLCLLLSPTVKTFWGRMRWNYACYKIQNRKKSVRHASRFQLRNANESLFALHNQHGVTNLLQCIELGDKCLKIWEIFLWHFSNEWACKLPVLLINTNIPYNIFFLLQNYFLLFPDFLSIFPSFPLFP